MLLYYGILPSCVHSTLRSVPSRYWIVDFITNSSSLGSSLLYGYSHPCGQNETKIAWCDFTAIVALYSSYTSHHKRGHKWSQCVGLLVTDYLISLSWEINNNYANELTPMGYRGLTSHLPCLLAKATFVKLREIQVRSPSAT